MRVLTWNTTGAAIPKNGNLAADKWKVLLKLNPDIAVLQEVFGVPECVRDVYHVEYQKATFFADRKANFGTAVLARKPDWTVGPEVSWESEYRWVNQIQETFPGWLIGRKIGSKWGGDNYSVVAVHAPAFPLKCDKKTPKLCRILDGVDIGPVKLQNNPKLWFTEILWSLLKGANTRDGTSWIVAGDFNSSRLFDKPKNKGNGEIIARLQAMGLLDCVFQYELQRHVCPDFGDRVPTYKQPNGSVVHQLDYIYVTLPLVDRLTNVRVGHGLPDVKEWISNHLPIICDFR